MQGLARNEHKAPPNPSKTVAFGFAAAILVGAAALMLPVSTHGAGGAPFRVAVFTSTSAVCVTGLAVVDTATYWTPFGQTIIMLLIQIGGLGIMTGASLLFLAVSKRVGLRNRMIAQQERGSINLGDVRRVLLGVIAFSILAEVIIATILALRFWARDDISFGVAVWRGVFHSVSAFNNAGFALFSANLMDYALDPIILITIGLAVVMGGIGFPVWIELQRRWKTADRWSLHTKLTLVTTGALVIGGWVLLTALEWNNPDTLGPMPVHGKLLSGFFASVVPRTAGFNSIDYSQMGHPGIMITDMLMFAGGGSGSTAGGIKVTTFALLGWVMWAEVRGERDVNVFQRRVPTDVQRQALTVALMAVGGVVGSSMLLLALTPFTLTDVIFEAVSALGTVGLSVGITPSLPIPAQLVITGLMFVGRVGPPTLFAALVLRDRELLYRNPEERIIIG